MPWLQLLTQIQLDLPVQRQIGHMGGSTRLLTSESWRTNMISGFTSMLVSGPMFFPFLGTLAKTCLLMIFQLMACARCQVICINMDMPQNRYPRFYGGLRKSKNTIIYRSLIGLADYISRKVL